MTTTPELPEDFATLVEEYHEEVIKGEDATKTEIDDETIEQLEQEIDTIGADLEEYDEDHPLYDVLEEEYEEKTERLENLRAASERQERLRTTLPQRMVSDFAATDEILTNTVIQSVSHALTGEVRTEIVVGNTQLSPENELDRDEIITTTKNIHGLAKCEAGRPNSIEELWESLSERDKSILGVLAFADDELGPTSIAERLDEDVSRGAVSPRLGKDRDRTHSLTYNGDDGYRLSLVGEYVWQEWGPEKETPDDGGEKAASSEDESSEKDVEQLDKFTD